MADDNFTVLVEEGTYAISTTTTLDNPATVESISDVGDIDLTTNGKVNGSVLVYRSLTDKWTATTLLENQVMEAGEF